jgi:hypothetical protein
MIAFEHTAQHRAHARELARWWDESRLKHPNHMKGETRAQGMLAEIIFAEVFALAFVDKQFRQDFRFGARIINIKSNHCRFFPLPHYEVGCVTCDLPSLNLAGFDLVFVMLSFQTTTAYIVGWLPLSVFIEESRLIKKGERLFGKRICETDCRRIQIEQLNTMDTFHHDGELFAGEFCLPLSKQ